MNHVVIMAGGIGARFWPLSTPEFPKQFIDILGCGRTLIQLTIDRFYGLCSESNFWVVTNENYVDLVKSQIPFIPNSHILAEPIARNTAPCIAWACWRIYQEDPEANIVVTPSDAIVMNPMEFQRVIKNALAFTANSNSIVTIGIKPNRPETGYGYVQTLPIPKGTSSVNNPESEIFPVIAFKEKPNFRTAEAYISKKCYLWNAGVFVWNIKTIIDSISKYKPNIAADMNEMLQTGDVQTIFPKCEKISIDFAVMEPAAADGFVYTHPADFGWSDLGNWHSLYEKLQKDDNNNSIVGNVKLFDSKNCIVHAEDVKKIVIQGLDGYIVSEKNGEILICKRSEEQRIKDFSLK